MASSRAGFAAVEGDKYSALRDYAEASEWYTKSLEAGGSGRVLLERGICQLQLRQWDDAEKDFLDAFERKDLAAHHPKIHEILGKFYLLKSCFVNTPEEEAKNCSLSLNAFAESNYDRREARIQFLKNIEYINSITEIPVAERKLPAGVHFGVRSDEIFYNALIALRQKNTDAISKGLLKLISNDALTAYLAGSTANPLYRCYFLRLLVAAPLLAKGHGPIYTGKDVSKLKERILIMTKSVSDGLRQKVLIFALSKNTFLGQLFYTASNIVSASIHSGRLKQALNLLERDFIRRARISIDPEMRELLDRDSNLKKDLDNNYPLQHDLLYPGSRVTQALSPSALYSSAASPHINYSSFSRRAEHVAESKKRQSDDQQKGVELANIATFSKGKRRPG